MFRNDICKVSRPAKEKVNGEVVYLTPSVVYDNIMCNLSKNKLTAVNQSQSIATLDYNFVLFTDCNINIQPNDIIEVTTREGQQFKLRAGQSKRYLLSTQTLCKEIDIV